MSFLRPNFFLARLDFFPPRLTAPGSPRMIILSLEQKNADGSGWNIREFTSLLGSQKKKLLIKRVLSRFNEFLYADTCDTVKKIWTDFEESYNLVTDPNGEPSEILVLKSQAWINSFSSLREKRPGY